MLETLRSHHAKISLQILRIVFSNHQITLFGIFMKQQKLLQERLRQLKQTNFCRFFTIPSLELVDLP